MKYLVNVGDPADPQWYEVEASTADDAVSAVRRQLFPGGEPLGAGVTIGAVVMPDEPIHIRRLADMTEFEAEFRKTPEFEWPDDAETDG